MVEPKSTITFLLKDVDKSLWGAVKTYVFNNGITIREFLIEAIKEKISRGEPNG